jgi:hypothetical protein
MIDSYEHILAKKERFGKLGVGEFWIVALEEFSVVIMKKY